MRGVIESLRKLPNGVKWLIGIISTLVPFVLLVRSNLHLVIALIGAMAWAAFMVYSLHVAIARDEPRLVGGRGTPRFGMAARRWAGTGLAFGAVGAVAIFAFGPSRAFLIDAFRGSRSPRAEILIAELHAPAKTAKTPEIARRLEQNLLEKLREGGRGDLRVRIMPAVASREEAMRLAMDAEAKVIVWGWYDDLGTQVHILARDAAGEGVEPSRLREIPWDLGGSSREFSLALRERLIPDVTFISLFVLGHLDYLEHRYREGRAAFDAAMAALPAGVGLENEAVLHFLAARGMQAAGASSVVVVCEYSRAVRLEPRFYEAYNNLAVALALIDFPLPVPAQDCLQKAGLGSVDEHELFERALELQPESLSARYNQIALRWRLGETEISYEQAEAQLEAMLPKGDGIPGVHLLLGVMAFDRGDLDKAERHFSRALEVAPELSRVRTNLGQIYVRRGDAPKAASAFEKALETDSVDPEAHLALAFLAERRRDAAAVAEHLDAAVKAEDRAFSDLQQVTDVLQSQVFWQQGEIVRAVETLELLAAQLGEGPPLHALQLLHFLLALLEEQRGDLGGAARHWNHTFWRYEEDIDEEEVAGWETLGATWYDLSRKCRGAAERDWGRRIPCLPSDLQGRIEQVYAAVRERAAFRLYFRMPELYGMACPYVFTYDAARGAWRFDTTILYGLVGPTRETTQTRELARFDGRLLIREVELETSYLDALHVIVEDQNGRSTQLNPRLPALREADGAYLVLETGAELLVEIEGFAAILGTVRSQVVAEGYYVPERRTLSRPCGITLPPAASAPCPCGAGCCGPSSDSSCSSPRDARSESGKIVPTPRAGQPHRPRTGRRP